MAITEILLRINNVLQQSEVRLKSSAERARNEIRVAQEIKSRPDDRLLGDPLRYGVSVAVIRARANIGAVRRNVVSPAATISGALKLYQGGYRSFRNFGTTSDLRSGARNVVNSVTHYAHIHPTQIGRIVENNLPQIIGNAKEAVDAQLTIEKYQAVLEADRWTAREKGGGGQDPGIDQSGTHVTVYDRQRVITVNPTRPSLGTLVKSLLRF